jgi:hypothetical protein
MTLETAFLMLILIYLVMIAYGVVGARRRGTPGKVRIALAALMVLIPPLAMLYALYSTGDAGLFAAWGKVTLAMLVSGVGTAIFTEYIARRVGS